MSVSQSVCLSVCHYFSHARCTGCDIWKKLEAETWTDTQLHNARNHNRPLLCGRCVSTSRQKGQTLRDEKMYSCAACREKKGRMNFEKGRIDRFNRVAGYLLVCTECDSKEKRLLQKLKAPQVRKCTRRCLPGMAHAENCGAHMYWYGYARDHQVCVTREDLAFLHFRPENKKYH